MSLIPIGAHSECNGQLRWLNLANVERGRIRVSHHGGSTMPLSIQEIFLENFPKWACELLSWYVIP